MFTQVLTAACFALFAQSALAQDCTRSYSVQPGDTCDSISAAQNVSTFQLATVNTGIINSDCTNLVPDENLCLGHTGEDCSTTYVVVAGDSCERINTVFSLNSTILSLNNPQIDADCSNIYIGEVLCVSTTVQVPPTPPSGSIPGKTIPATATPARPTSTPKATSAPAPSTSHAAPPPPKTTTPAQDHHDNGDDENDEDLPYCDEI